MGFIPIGLAVTAGALSYGQNAIVTCWVAVIAAVLGLWSYGVMHNYAVAAASRRRSYRGGFGDFMPAEADEAPRSWTMVNMLSAIVSVLAFGAAVVRSL